jgi:hypothetical protein
LLSDGTFTVVNSTISGNTAIGNPAGTYSGDGGGMLIGSQSGPSVHALINTTVANNSSNVLGGGLFFGSLGPPVNLYFANTLFAENTAPVGPNCGEINPDIWLSLGHNLEDANTCPFDQPTDQVNTDPLLGPLQDNGGPTWTHALLDFSPAIDAGDDTVCAAAPVNGIDQRGVARPIGPHCDIGAYESAALPPIPITGLTAVNDSPTLLGSPTTLTAAVATGEAISYTWSYGDGQTGQGATTTHTYADVGVYTAVVTATNPVNTVTATTTVTIIESGYEFYLPVVLKP